MIKREDSSGFCYHWVKANVQLSTQELRYEEAFQTLLKILTSLELKSGQFLNLLNGHSCICFTETPVTFIISDRSKYQPFGLGFFKSDIHKLGGQPVLNLSQDDYNFLPHHIRWRYARHEPLLRDENHPYGIDFSWEREIRVNSNIISLMGESLITTHSSIDNVDFAFSNVFVPNNRYVAKLLSALHLNWSHKFSEFIKEKPQDAYWYRCFLDSLMDEFEEKTLSLNMD
ncbi:hypothetical protein [Pantoea agglomerans]|uniref:hypothetical protein n=1 Tax=Enterobacter agglomerans TaxID=549 RepID=UPI00110F96BF|nr:hypothetical protein [Pantoea agglomerans]